MAAPRWATRVEIKNLNSFRALERATAYEIQRQVEVVRKGGAVAQETLGWDEASGVTFSQRSKEEAHDYRYFPEPDLPPLVVENEWIERVRASLPELPQARLQRFQEQYGLGKYDTSLLVNEQAVADFFEQAVASAARPAAENHCQLAAGRPVQPDETEQHRHFRGPDFPCRTGRAGGTGEPGKNQQHHGEVCAGRDVRQRRNGLRRLSPARD